MIKKIALFAVAALLAVGASAQIKINAGAGLLMPMGTFGDVYKMGFGGNIGGKYMLNDKMSVGLNLGIFSLKPSSDYEDLMGTTDIKYTLMPISGNFSYYFGSEGLKPYAGIDLGYYTIKAKVAGLSVSSSEFGFAPVVGVEYGLSDKLSLDANVKYHYIMTEDEASTALGINVGIVYAF